MTDDDRPPRRPRTSTHYRGWRSLREFLIVRPSHGPTRYRARPRFLISVTFALHGTRFRNALVLSVCNNASLMNSRFIEDE